MTGKERIDGNDLRLLSKLFSYPERFPEPGEMERTGGTWSDSTGTGPNDSLTSLQNEYVRLFINALPEAPCPPYGSLYLEGSLMGASTLRLRNLYATHGFITDEMADHIAVELEFLALLSTLSQNSRAEEDFEFILDHLGKWTPKFFSRVETNDTTGFYRDLSKFACKILKAKEPGKSIH